MLMPNFTFCSFYLLIIDCSSFCCKNTIDKCAMQPTCKIGAILVALMHS